MTTTILLIYTGGTIGMVQDPTTGQLKPFDFDHLISQIPELKKFNYTIDSLQFQSPIDSSNITPDIWTELAQLIFDNHQKYDGFVVLHGTDTMAFSASAISFMLQNLNKPVIFTGSQLPIGVIRTDGKENLITAIEIAAAKKNGVPIVPEVAIYFEYHLYRGNRTTKISASHFEAFDSPNYSILAEAGIDIDYNTEAIQNTNNKPASISSQLNSNVGIVKFFPGIQPGYIEPLLTHKDLEVVILETYGSGNIPTLPWFEDLAKQAIDSGKYLINVSQCLRGTVKQGSYQTSSFLDSVGVIGGGNITLEAAITKSMYLLGKGSKNFREEFLEIICGEMN